MQQNNDTPKPDELKVSVEGETISTDTSSQNLIVANDDGVLELPVVPIREGVLFPSTESVLTFGRKISLNAIKDANGPDKRVILLAQRDPKENAPQPEDLYEIGTLAVIEKTLKTEDSLNALVRGIGRVRILSFSAIEPKMIAKAVRLEDQDVKDQEMDAMVTHLQKEFRKAVHMGKPVEFLNFMKLMGGVTNGELVDQVASTLSIKTKEKQIILQSINVKNRIKLVIEHLAHEMKVLEIEKDVVSKTQEKFDKHMRESILRERLRTIQKELGDIDDDEAVVSDYEQKLKKAPISLELKKKIKKEVKRLKQMSVNNPEAGYLRSWLDTIFELPWGKTAKSEVKIAEAAKILDKNHYGLEEVKDRILEYMSVLQLKHERNAKQASDTAVRLPTILCFVGPPGVGKTSIGRSIAEALGRKFVKVSLGGIHDEAEIRGHRRTYVGAMPGRIINGIKQAGSMNPVFMLDEIDKVGNDYRGDPSSALLEALDPEQNDSFEDHYLDIPFDLSNVIFITTANTLDTIPPALRDRLEIIRYAGYTAEEKFHIAQDHLLKKVIEVNGLTAKDVRVTKKAIQKVIQVFTREAGVRELERTLNAILRKVAKSIASASVKRPRSQISVTPQSLEKYLGPEKFDVSLTEAEDVVGQATGLAWTAVGGEVLFIEVALTPGKGKVVLTGKLGDVMKESAQAALTYVKANAKQLGISQKKITTTDIHVHIPEGAVPKDGPSAGVTMTTAIVSAFCAIPVKKEVAMTGEVTLRGRVLRIGGLKEKSIAAQAAGSKTVLIPKGNARDLIKLPESVKKSLTFIPVETVSEVLQHALVRSTKK